jgi:hypothetical protein
MPKYSHPLARDGGPHAIGGAVTGNDLLHLLLLVDSHSKSGFMIGRVVAGDAKAEGRLDFRDGSIVTRGNGTIEDPAIAWLIPAAKASLVEFRFVFEAPPKIPGELAVPVNLILATVAEHMASS